MDKEFIVGKCAELGMVIVIAITWGSLCTVLDAPKFVPSLGGLVIGIVVSIVFNLYRRHQKEKKMNK